MSIRSYDEVAAEYYNPRHRTSRNFDRATAAAIRGATLRVPAAGRILDVGAGKGRCIEYLGVDASRIVQLDSCRAMLELPEREGSVVRVLHDAVPLPFLNGSFSCVAAFLADGFWGLEFLAEAHRVLEQNGLFVATLPNHTWGRAIRAKIGIDEHSTRFVTSNGDRILVPSNLVPIAQAKAMCEVVGFPASQIQVTPHGLAPGDSDVSGDIAKAADVLECGVGELAILDVIVATK